MSEPITAAQVIRVENRDFSPFDPCVVCGKTFNSCPHTLADTMPLIKRVQALSKEEREAIKAAPPAPKPEPALHNMLRKADEGISRGNLGYVTYLPELREILAELTDAVPVGIIVRRDPLGRGIDVNITVGFTLDSDILEQTGETRK